MNNLAMRPRRKSVGVLKKSVRGLALIIPALALLCTVYVAMSPLVAMPFYANLIFDPATDGNFYPSTISNCPVHTVWVPAGKTKKLFAWYVKNPRAHTTVLLSHGNSGDLSDRVELINKLIKAGASVFAYDYEGFGLSPGTPGVDSACRDGLAAYDYLTNRLHVKPSSVVLFGESLGTGVSCQIAKVRKCNGIILQSPFTSLLSIAREKMQLMNLYPDLLFPRQRMDSLSVVERPHPRLLVVHGAKDPLIPLRHAEELFSQARSPKQLVVLPDGHHEDMPDIDARQYDAALRAFIHAT